MVYYREKKRTYASDGLRKLILILLSALIIFCIVEITAVIKDTVSKSTSVLRIAENGVITVFDSESKSVAAEPDISVPKEAKLTFAEPAEGVLTSAFGQRNGRRHTGIDIGGENGSDIRAAADGTVTYADRLGGYGNYVVIDHGNGIQTAYGHCSSINISVGDNVVRGQKIAYMGSTGNSTGPHLHFEVKQDGEFLNPLDYVVY